MSIYSRLSLSRVLRNRDLRRFRGRASQSEPCSQGELVLLLGSVSLDFGPIQGFFSREQFPLSCFFGNIFLPQGVFCQVPCLSHVCFFTKSIKTDRQREVVYSITIGLRNLGVGVLDTMMIMVKKHKDLEKGIDSGDFVFSLIQWKRLQRLERRSREQGDRM